jgi:uncharacterized protein (TIGR03089 family)
MPGVTDVWTLLGARRRASPGAPLVTFVSGEGERTELSVTSLENAASKIANALRDEFDLDAGAAVGVHLPLHWQQAAWCAGIWTAGCVVVPEGGPETVDLVVAGPREAEALTSAGAQAAVVSLHPFGLPLNDPLPAGAMDVTIPVRQQPDAYLFEPPVGDVPALHIDGVLRTQDEVVELARERAAAWGLPRGGCLLLDETAPADDRWLALVAVPLAMDGSVVLAANGVDLDRIVAQERVTTRVA